MWALLKRWPLLTMAVLLLGVYITLAQTSKNDGPRTFIAGLAAMLLGAWLYSYAHGDTSENKSND